MNTCRKPLDGSLNAAAGLTRLLPSDGGNCEAVFSALASSGVDLGNLAQQLQHEGAQAFVKPPQELMDVISAGSIVLRLARKDNPTCSYGRGAAQ